MTVAKGAILGLEVKVSTFSRTLRRMSSSSLAYTYVSTKMQAIGTNMTFAPLREST